MAQARIAILTTWVSYSTNRQTDPARPQEFGRQRNVCGLSGRSYAAAGVLLNKIQIAQQHALQSTTQSTFQSTTVSAID